MHRVCLAILAVAVIFMTPQARALEAISAEQSGQFLGWCTGAGNTETVCSCTLKRLAATMPPAALATFLADKTSGGGRFSMSTASITAATLVTEALTQCAK